MQCIAGINFLTEAIVNEVILVLGLMFFGGIVVFGFIGIRLMAKEASPPRVREIKRAPMSSPMGRIPEFAELCTETCTDVAGLRRRGRLGL